MYSSSLGSQIPVELFPLIIEHGQGKEALSSFSLVSKAWCKFAQPYLFRTLSLTCTQRCITLRHLLHASPHLADLVQHLILGSTEMEYFIPAANCLLDELGDIQVSSRLKNVKHLEIVSLPIGARLFLAIREYVDTLTAMTLKYIEVRPSRFLLLIGRFVALKHLCIADVNLSAASDDPELSELLATYEPSSSTAFKSLSIRDAVAVELFTISPNVLNWGSLESLELVWTYSNTYSTAWRSVRRRTYDHMFGDFIETVAAPVKKLSLRVTDPDDFVEGPVGEDTKLQYFKQSDILSTFTSLCSLNLQYEVDHDIPLTGLPIVSVLPKVPYKHLEDITLVLNFEPTISTRQMTDIYALASMEGWRDIEKALSQASSCGLGTPPFRCLNVVFQDNKVMQKDGVWDRVEEEIERHCLFGLVESRKAELTRTGEYDSRKRETEKWGTMWRHAEDVFRTRL